MKSNGLVCEIANMNAPNQLVLSGHAEAVKDAAALIRSRKLCKKCVELSVSAPFHSSLLQPAALELDNALANITIRPPSIPIIGNVTADLVPPEEDWKRLMVRQVTAPVRWSEGMQRSFSLEGGEYVEFGPGNVLSSLVKQNAPTGSNVKVTTVGTVDEVRKFVETFER